MKRSYLNITITLFVSVLSLAFYFIIVEFNIADSFTLLLPHLLLISISLFLDYRSLKSISSPLFFFCFVYIISILIPIFLNESSLSHKLSNIELEKGSFIYLLYLMSCVFVYNTGNKVSSKEPVLDLILVNDIKKYYIVSLIFGIIGLTLRLYSYSSYSGFSIRNMITDSNLQYFLTRQYGRNWAAIFSEIFAVLSIIIAITINKDLPMKLKPSNGSIIFSGIIILFNALVSGNKTNFFWPFIGFFVIQGFVYKKLKNIRLILFSVITLFSLLLAFIWRGAFNKLSEAPSALAEYNQLFFYTAKSVDKITPNSKYLIIALEDLATYPIPRILWSSKPQEMGLTRRYLEYLLISPNLPLSRSFSTMGLSEAWLATGYGGILFSGLLMGLLLSYSRKQLLHPKNLSKLIFAAYIYGTIYFLIRVGFLNIYIYNMLFTFLFLLFVHKISFRKRMTKLA